jgi:hypothetical protein
MAGMGHNRPIVPRDFNRSLWSALAGARRRTAGPPIAAYPSRPGSQPGASKIQIARAWVSGTLFARGYG